MFLIKDSELEGSGLGSPRYGQSLPKSRLEPRTPRMRSATGNEDRVDVVYGTCVTVGIIGIFVYCVYYCDLSPRNAYLSLALDLNLWYCTLFVLLVRVQPWKLCNEFF